VPEFRYRAAEKALAPYLSDASRSDKKTQPDTINLRGTAESQQEEDWTAKEMGRVEAVKEVHAVTSQAGKTKRIGALLAESKRKVYAY
jgi:hypothetical protein